MCISTITILPSVYQYFNVPEKQFGHSLGPHEMFAPTVQQRAAARGEKPLSMHHTSPISGEQPSTKTRMGHFGHPVKILIKILSSLIVFINPLSTTT